MTRIPYSGTVSTHRTRIPYSGTVSTPMTRIPYSGTVSTLGPVYPTPVQLVHL